MIKNIFVCNCCLCVTVRACVRFSVSQWERESGALCKSVSILLLAIKIHQISQTTHTSLIVKEFLGYGGKNDIHFLQNISQIPTDPGNRFAMQDCVHSHGCTISPLSRPEPAACTLWEPPPAMGPTVNWKGLPVDTTRRLLVTRHTSIVLQIYTSRGGTRW